MDALMAYRSAVEAQLKEVFESQRAALQAAAEAMARALQQGHWIYSAGTGHSHLLALETFYRAGGLVRAVPLLADDLMLHVSASASSECERQPGRGEALLQQYGVGPGDVLWVISNSGRNAVPIELAMAGRRRGATVLALTSRRHSLAHPSRHESGKRLLDVADVVLDNAGVEGDAVVDAGFELEGGATSRVGATSTVIGAAILQAVTAEAVQRVQAAGGQAEVYQSSNGAGEARNQRWLQQYRGIVPHL
jgi:uncharacterized phosphosugar-binding protein